ncbi:MAG: Ribonuclease HII [candidate division WS2 bacterium ADurb.Bin280]|uniref:Ribonuclease HII n=1 Tax=candidate division WS2 bacterium ADurb.Bin280 TaxID=1852829 RepID=A0A1V5SFH5_9BACT|nr:MAG: Ribonuclease HII [candidate division WS2 bacterium ADurb.Bin280]
MDFERNLQRRGFEKICGIDEAGKGALAGPLVSAAVIAPIEGFDFEVNDSKKLSAKRRQEISLKIKEKAIAWSVGVCQTEEINSLGIKQAMYLCYERSICDLKIKPDYLIIDYFTLPSSTTPQTGITKGDQVSATIAAASIIAKTTRDEIMKRLAKKYSFFKFEKNFGYGTADHRQAIKTHGPTCEHRKLFIRNCLKESVI